MSLEVTKRGYTREEAAEYAGVSLWKVADAVRSNTLPAKRNGRDIVVLREDLDTWIDSWEVA